MNFNVTLVLLVTKCSLLYAAITNRWEVRRLTPITGHGRTQYPEGRIVGGHEAQPHSHPYLVSLQLRFLWVRAHICGGTLLNEYWVLTAGHCVLESWLMRWIPMDAVAGAHDVDKLGPETQVLTVTRRITHPNYKGDIGPNDIALLQTGRPFTFTKEIQPVNLPRHVKGNLDLLTLSGWGVLKTTFFFPDLPGKLQEVNVTYVPYEECYKAVDDLREPNEDNPLDNEANICTGPLTGGIAGCNGDSGGPLVQYISSSKYYDNDFVEESSTVTTDNYYNDYDSNNANDINNEDVQIPVVVGVVSWGVTPCGQKGAPTVYTRVSNYLDFINQYVKTDE